MKIIELAKKEGIDFDYWNIPDKGSRRVCKWPWKACYITVEGYITPCCIHGTNPKVINFGNIFEQGFENIWNCPEYMEFRRRLKSENPPEICIDCPSYYRKIKV